MVYGAWASTPAFAENLAIAPVPAITEDPVWVVQNALEILQGGLESYQIAHWGDYPDALVPETLIATLKGEGRLPLGFALPVAPSAFHCDPTGYRILLAADGQTREIASPAPGPNYWRLIWPGVKSGS